MSQPASPPARTALPLAGAGFALLGFALFSTHDAIIKSFGGKLAVVEIMFFSALFAFPWASIMIMLDEREENFRPRRPFLLIARTVLGLASAGFAFYAFMVLPLAEVYGFIFATPLLITLLAVPFLGEKLGLIRMSAVALGFMGVLIMLPTGEGSLGAGHLSALGCAVCGSLNAILTRKIGTSEREAVMLMLPLLLSLILLGSLLPFVYVSVGVVELYKLIAIGGLGFCGQLFIIRAYRKSAAAIVAPMQYSQLLWAIIFGALFFDERLSGSKLVGALVIVTSGLIILYRERKGGASASQPTSSFRNFRPDTMRAWVKGKEHDAAD